MPGHIFLTARDLARSVRFCDAVLPPLGIAARHEHDGKTGPMGHPDLKSFGANGHGFFWLTQGEPAAVHV